MHLEVSIQVNLLEQQTTYLSIAILWRAKDLLSYFSSTIVKRIVLKIPELLEVKIYMDTSYRNPVATTGKSQNACIMTIEGNIVDWSTQKQDIIAVSIIEVEYIVCCKRVKNTVEIRQLYAKLSIMVKQPLLILADSEETMKLSKTTKFYQKL